MQVWNLFGNNPNLTTCSPFCRPDKEWQLILAALVIGRCSGSRPSKNIFLSVCNRETKLLDGTTINEKHQTFQAWCSCLRWLPLSCLRLAVWFSLGPAGDCFKQEQQERVPESKLEPASASASLIIEVICETGWHLMTLCTWLMTHLWRWGLHKKPHVAGRARIAKTSKVPKHPCQCQQISWYNEDWWLPH